MNWPGPEMDDLKQDKDQTNKVLKMRATPSDTFHSPVNQDLLEYWRTLCRDRPRPAWSEVELMDLFRIAPRLVVKDLIDGGAEFRNRYWGTKMTDVLGYDATGALLKDQYPPNAAAALGKMYRLALTTSLPVRLVAVSSMVKRKEYLNLEAIVLPLDAAPNVIGHLICAFNYDYKLQPGELTGDGSSKWPEYWE